MIKKNIAIVSLETNISKKISKQIAEKFDMFFADTNDILSYKLQNKKFENNIDINLLEKKQKELLNDINNYENTTIFCNFELLTQSNNLEIIKNNAILVYLKVDKDEFQKDNLSFNLGYAFDFEDKFCEQNCDIKIEITKDTKIDDILNILTRFLSKGEFVWQFKKKR